MGFVQGQRVSAQQYAGTRAEGVFVRRLPDEAQPPRLGSGRTTIIRRAEVQFDGRLKPAVVLYDSISPIEETA